MFQFCCFVLLTYKSCPPCIALSTCTPRSGGNHVESFRVMLLTCPTWQRKPEIHKMVDLEKTLCGLWQGIEMPSYSKEQSDTVGAFSAAQGTKVSGFHSSERPASSCPFLPSHTRAKEHQKTSRGRCLNKQLKANYSLVYKNIFLTTFKENSLKKA